MIQSHILKTKLGYQCLSLPLQFCRCHLKKNPHCLHANSRAPSPFASPYSLSTSLTKSPTPLPPSQSFHTPPSLIQRTSPASLTVQLFVTLYFWLLIILSRSRFTPCALASLMQ